MKSKITSVSPSPLVNFTSVMVLSLGSGSSASSRAFGFWISARSSSLRSWWWTFRDSKISSALYIQLCALGLTQWVCRETTLCAQQHKTRWQKSGDYYILFIWGNSHNLHERKIRVDVYWWIYICYIYRNAVLVLNIHYRILQYQQLTQYSKTVLSLIWLEHNELYCSFPTLLIRNSPH